jgi:hypothetical protein
MIRARLRHDTPSTGARRAGPTGTTHMTQGHDTRGAGARHAERGGATRGAWGRDTRSVGARHAGIERLGEVGVA